MALARIFSSGRFPRLLRQTNSWNKCYSRALWTAPKERISAKKVAGVCVALGGAGLVINNYKQQVDNPVISSNEEDQPSTKVALPEYSLDEVSKHNSKENGIWVSYKDGVYDVTTFVEQHPGGVDNILLAAGCSLEPFWAVFAQHDTELVRGILEELRIGNLTQADRDKKAREAPTEGPYANDPIRSPLLNVLYDKPFTAEPSLTILRNRFLTPNDIFFVSNHLPVPLIDPESYVLEVSREGMGSVKLTLEDLKTKFPQHTITVTIQCAGNRRAEMNKVKEIAGTPWVGGAIGNAQWTGVLLRDVLLYMGLKEDDMDVQHVHLEGIDHNPVTGEHYGASIPIVKAMDPKGDCLLAYEMNGVDLPQDHGFPLRAVIPGTIGARNVKWLGHIVASKNEYSGFWQQQDYKTFSPSTDWDKVDFSKAPAIQEWPMQSLICSPLNGTTIDSADEITLKGIAWSGGGRVVARVDVSVDGGKTWHVADLSEGTDQKQARAWAWTFWDVTISVPENHNGELEVCCKAVDLANNVQPANIKDIWNVRGFLTNVWHHIHVKLPEI